MARIRSMKPEFFRSRSLAQCSIPARLTFAGLWTEADDCGNGIADADILKGSLWPKDHAITADDVASHLDELEHTGHIIRYQVDGEPFFHVVSWPKHQPPSTRRGEGKYPGPENADDPARSREIFHDDDSSPRDSARQVVLGQGSGVRGHVAPTEPARNGTKAARPPDLLWDALMAACEVDTTAITTSARGGYNRALKDLRTAGADPPELHRRAREHKRRWPGATLTPTSLAKHWAELKPASTETRGQERIG